MRLMPALAAAWMLAAPAYAQESSFEKGLAAARLEIRQEADGSFSGSGWDSLIAAGRGAQFFMIGEQHGVAEIINFAASVHRELAPSGYTHAAMEVGPYSTEAAERMMRSGAGKFEEFVAQPGNNRIFPFLSWKEEIALAEQYIRLSPDRRKALLGVDQEFVGSAPLALAALKKRVRSKLQRAAVADFEAKVAADPEFVLRAKDEDTEALLESFRGDSEALGMIEAIRFSSKIYAPFTIAGSNRYWANLTRENYMKWNFARQYAEAERRIGRPPKVFAKFGGNHAMRGFSASTVPAFANFLAEWGVPRGFKLVTVMADCASSAPGTAPACQPYFGTNSPFMLGASKDRPTLYDLRPLRARLRSMESLDMKARDLIQAFDYYLLIPNVTRAARATKKAAA